MNAATQAKAHDADDILIVKNLDVFYGKFQANKKVSLNVQSGEMFGLMGLNGAGKTTLIKAILGLRRADAGEIEVFGASHNSQSVKQKIAFLPERFEPSWFLSGYEFLQFALKLYNRSPVAEDINECAELLDMGQGILNKSVSSYSKGMRQKLGILSILLSECPLMILDEPMSGLDPKARAQVKDLLKLYNAKGHTIIMCSHILGDMEELCDRVALMHENQIRTIAIPSELTLQTNEKNLERAFLALTSQKT